MGSSTANAGNATVYDPADPRYWDGGLLAQEIDRVYDICHGCRLCFNLCPSFPSLFDAIDRHPGEVGELTSREKEEVVDLCFQCKLCYLKCPYTPDDGHDFQLDFPGLMQRAHLVECKAHGVPLRERLLSDPDRIGRMARPLAGLVNWVHRQPLLRVLMEKTMGIHRDKQMPRFFRESFRRWFTRHASEFDLDGSAGKVVLFHTCFVDSNAPDIGRDAVRVLAHNGCTLRCPEQNCCGMPALDGGDLELARRKARTNIRKLLPWVREGYRILAINPTCSLMLRREYPRLVAGQEAEELSGAVMDLHEFLFSLDKEGGFRRDFRSTPGTIHYHVPCHLRAQSIGYRSRDMMKRIPGARIELADRCSGHDGTWAMKREFFDASLKFAQPTFDLMRKGEPGIYATDCPLAALQFEQGMGVRPLHPIQVLARAYEEDGFPTRVRPASPEADSS